MLETEVLDASTTVEETSPIVDAPVAPDLEAAPAASDELVTTDPAAKSDRPRDSNGRFLKTDGTPVAPAEQSALEAAPPATPAAGVPAKTGEPFAFRADGQKIPIPGSMLSADGALTIPPDQVAVVRQLLSEGIAHRGSWRQKEADYQRQVTEAGATEKARADKYNTAAVMLFDKIMNDDWLVSLAQDPQRERDYLRRELGLSLRDADLNAPRRSPAPTAPASGTDDSQLEQNFKSALHEEVEDLLDDPQFKGLFSADERKDVLDAFADNMQSFAAMVDGSVKLDLHKLRKVFDREVAKQKRIAQANADALKMKQFNEKRQPVASNAPPVISTKGPGSTGASPKKFASKEEYNKWAGLS